MRPHIFLLLLHFFFIERKSNKDYNEECPVQ